MNAQHYSALYPDLAAMIPSPRINSNISYSDPDPISVLIGRPAWHTQAACSCMVKDGATDVNPFFPNKGVNAQQLVAQAKQICAGCPVRTECLDDALDRGEKHGAGGTTPKERRLLRAARRAA